MKHLTLENVGVFQKKKRGVMSQNENYWRKENYLGKQKITFLSSLKGNAEIPTPPDSLWRLLPQDRTRLRVELNPCIWRNILEN